MKRLIESSRADWKRGFQLHSEALKRLGLLAEIAEEPHRWWRFLGHGCDSETSWTPELLPAAQQRELLSYILMHFPDDDLSGLKLLMRNAGLLP
jgi:hypothetical protein